MSTFNDNFTNIRKRNSSFPLTNLWLGRPIQLQEEGLLPLEVRTLPSEDFRRTEVFPADLMWTPSSCEYFRLSEDFRFARRRRTCRGSWPILHQHRWHHSSFPEQQTKTGPLVRRRRSQRECPLSVNATRYLTFQTINQSISKAYSSRATSR